MRAGSYHQTVRSRCQQQPTTTSDRAYWALSAVAQQASPHMEYAYLPQQPAEPRDRSVVKIKAAGVITWSEVLSDGIGTRTIERDG